MTDIVHKSLMPGVGLACLTTEKFKTSVLSLSLLRPLRQKEAAMSALLPQVLCRGTQTYPDMAALSAKLESLYGASLEPAVRKKGEIQSVGLVSAYIDGRYLPGAPNQLGAVAALMAEMLLRPAGDGNCFVTAYVESERANLADQIRAAKNDKRVYANNRLLEYMCAEEAYGVDRLGREADTVRIGTADLWRHYKTILASSQLEAVYIGPASPEKVASVLLAAFTGLPRQAAFDKLGTQVVRTARATRQFSERMEVSQGKLTMGMRLGVSSADADYPAALMATAIFGGTTTSKLFLHVRERLQLCYYASSWMEGLKGLLIVSSGIEPRQRQAAESEILAQWNALCRGEVTEEELMAARLSLSGMLRATNDQPGRLEDFYLGQAAAGLYDSPDALAQRVDAVTFDDIVRVARGATWDSTYFLSGEVTA